VLPRVPQLWTPPPYSEGLWCGHMPHDSESHLPARESSGTAMCPAALDSISPLGRAPVLSRVPRLGTRLPTQEGSSTATCPMTLSRLQALGINKVLAGLGVQLGSHVFKAHSRIFNARTRVSKAPTPEQSRPADRHHL
jgi:hypothetical protein